MFSTCMSRNSLADLSRNLRVCRYIFLMNGLITEQKRAIVIRELTLYKMSRVRD